MQIWHLTDDAPRTPMRVAPGDLVEITVGTWPVSPGQQVVVEAEIASHGGTNRRERAQAHWTANRDGNSYWRAELGPFARGDRVTYRIVAGDAEGSRELPAEELTVGARAHLALLWHQHQPLYQSLSARDAHGSIAQPWVRLHTLRDYVAMPMLAMEAPCVRVTFNLSPSLLVQVQHYLDGATDRALDLTLTPAENLDEDDRAELLATFFDADWNHQIEPHPRYRALFEARRDGRPFDVQDLRDLQMWANLAWFADEYRRGEVMLPTGEAVSVKPFIERGAGYRPEDIRDMVAEQYKLLRAVVPTHGALAKTGRIELTPNPFFHPILPILIDSDAATVDLPGASRPPRFAHPDDAEAQVASAVQAHTAWFGAAPRGMWPSEGAVSPALVPLLARHGLAWMATDEGVLARSGRWGYDVTRPEVLYTPHRAEHDGAQIAVFFRDRRLSDAIGFALQREPDPEVAADAWLAMLRARIRTLPPQGDHVVTVILDGENPWGGYADDGRPFLRALYHRLSAAADIEMVTFSEWIDGAPARRLAAHPLASLPIVHELFPGSWIDEYGSAPGVDHGTWLGEPDENDAWALLGRTRNWLVGQPAASTAAMQALHAAEGSDWFWWLGADQDSNQDPAFDALFRDHVASVYRLSGAEPPPELEPRVPPHTVVWELMSPAPRLHVGERLLVRTHCNGRLSWWTDRTAPVDVPLASAGGVMSGPRRRQAIVGPFASPGTVSLRVRCDHPRNGHLCCNSGVAEVIVTE